MKKKKSNEMAYTDGILFTNYTPKVCLIASLNNVKIVLLPAHSSHLIQALDAIPFAVHKRKINYMDEEGMSQQSQDIFTNLNAW